jgi:hypothetical protein
MTARFRVPLLILMGVLLALALFRAPVAPAARPVHAAFGGGGSVTLLAWFDLPKDDPRSHDLSGLTWDAATGTLYAISDRTPWIVPLRPGPGRESWTFGETIPVTIPEQWDAEGLALTERGFLLSNEFGPHVYELNRAGQSEGELPLPAHFSRIRRNLALEALSLTPDGRYLFTANEAALDGDGDPPTPDAGTTIRILRHDRETGAQAEYAYRTDPVFAPGEGGDRGVVDMAVLSPVSLLVMERSFVPEIGNNVTLYRVDLTGAANVIDDDTLSPATPVVAKTRLVDLSELPDAGLPAPLQPQPHPILDNFEGMTLGPLLPDGRRLLFLVSDDNSRETQTPRLLVLAVAGL